LLAYSSGGGLDAWLHALDLVEALKPTRVVAGHKDKTRDDDPTNIAATRKYLSDAKGLLAANPTQLQFPRVAQRGCQKAKIAHAPSKWKALSRKKKPLEMEKLDMIL
jgi:hypothetical protein